MKTLPTKYQEIEKHVYTHDSERHSAYTTVKVVFFCFLFGIYLCTRRINIATFPLKSKSKESPKHWKLANRVEVVRKPSFLPAPTSREADSGWKLNASSQLGLCPEAVPLNQTSW